MNGNVWTLKPNTRAIVTIRDGGRTMDFRWEWRHGGSDWPMTWRTFLRTHWRGLFPADFFTTEVWTERGLVTYYTLFVIELHSRRVHVLGSTRHPNEAFVIQTMRHLTDDADGVLRKNRMLICDRDRKWSATSSASSRRQASGSFGHRSWRLTAMA